jgi:hypothetical protein
MTTWVGSCRTLSCLSDAPHPVAANRRTRREGSPLLVTARLTERTVELCRNAGVACLDLNGRVWIRRDSVLVDRSPPPDHEPVVAKSPEPELFSGKSSRLARALFSGRKAWTQAELATATGISRPRLSVLLEALSAQGFVRREGSPRGGTWNVSQPDAFIDAWARRSSLAKIQQPRQRRTNTCASARNW